MTRQLQIKNGVAVNEWQGQGQPPVPPDGSWVFIDVTQRPDAQIGMNYDAEVDTFTAPASPPNYGRTVSPREFLLLFTAAERIAIRQAGKASDTVADWYDLAMQPAEPIRLQHPQTIGGLNFLVAQGLLTAERKAEILAS